MEQENITTYECLKEEVAGMRGDLSRVLDYIVAKEEKERKAKEKTMPGLSCLPDRW